MWGQRLSIVRVNELCMCVCYVGSVVMCDVCDVLVSCDVLCDSSVTTGCSYTVLDPNICCCLREGGCSGAANLATIFRGSFYSIQRRRFSNTVSLLKAHSVGHLLRIFAKFRCHLQWREDCCSVEGGGNATQNVSHLHHMASS